MDEYSVNMGSVFLNAFQAEHEAMAVFWLRVMNELKTGAPRLSCWQSLMA